MLEAIARRLFRVRPLEKGANARGGGTLLSAPVVFRPEYTVRVAATIALSRGCDWDVPVIFSRNLCCTQISRAYRFLPRSDCLHSVARPRGLYSG